MLFHTSGRQLLNRILVMSATVLSKTIILLKEHEKPSSKELYSTLMTNFTNQPSPNVYFEKIFPNLKFDWRKIYILPCITTINTYLRSFQYKILNNIFFLNKKLLVFRMKNTPLCSCYNKEEEKLLHIFSECTSVIYLWQQLATSLKTI